MDRAGRSLSKDLIANSSASAGGATTAVCLGLGGNYLKISVRQPAQSGNQKQTSSRDLSIIIKVLLERISTKKYENAEL